MPPRRVAPYRLAGGVFLAVAALYLLFPAARFNFDGVACAIAVDTGDWKHLVHGNHLAYGFLGYLFAGALSGICRLWQAPLPALFSLQIFSSLLGAAGASIFSLALLECGIDPLVAAACAMGLAVSKIYWIWSLEAQVYPLGAFFLFWAAREAFRPDPRPARLGLLHAGAVLGHVGHLMFLPAAWHVLRDRKPRLRYLIALGGGLSAAYAAAAVFIMRPGSWEEWRVWLLGSAALGVGRDFAWHGGYSWAGLRDWLRITSAMAGIGAWGSLILIAAAVVGAARAERGERKIAQACLLWLGSYAVLYLGWEPYTPVYRTTDLAPLWILAALAAGEIPWKREAKILAPALFAAALGGWNLAREILPASDPGANADLQRALWVSRQTPENAWVVVDGVDQVYIPYFAHRRPVNLRYFGNEAELFQRVAGLKKAGDPVFVVLQAVSAPWRDSLARHSSPAARAGAMEIRRITPKPN